MTRNFEVNDRTAKEWDTALLKGFEIWRKLNKCEGGIVIGDLFNRSLMFEEVH